MNLELSLIYPGNQLNTYFLIFIVLMSVVDMLTYFPKNIKHIDFKSSIVSVGVLGTFVGVYIGLSEFDANDISASVPPLLEGLQVAFYTSISGMFFALLLTVLQKANPGYSELDDDSGVLRDIDDKLDTLDKIQKNTEALPILPNQITSVLYEIRDSMVSNNKEMLSMLTIEMGEIKNTLKEATESLAKGATEEIIKALETVISDFNTNLTEQFGDNFKQLNESVINMIQWQENYKSTIESLEAQLKDAMSTFEESIDKGQDALNDVFEQFKLNSDKLIESSKDGHEQIQNSMKESAVALEETSGIISGLKDDFSSISEMSSKLGTVIETNQNQISNLEAHLESMSKIGKDANEMTSSIKDFSVEVQDSLTSQSKSLSKMTQELDKQLPEALGKLNKSLSSLTEQFAKDYERFLQLVAKLMKDGR